MGYFETKEGILIGDRQADIIDGIIGNLTFEQVIKDKELCKDLYNSVKSDFMGRKMTKKEFVGHLAFCTCSDYSEKSNMQRRLRT